MVNGGEPQQASAGFARFARFGNGGGQDKNQIEQAESHEAQRKVNPALSVAGPVVGLGCQP